MTQKKRKIIKPNHKKTILVIETLENRYEIPINKNDMDKTIAQIISEYTEYLLNESEL